MNQLENGKWYYVNFGYTTYVAQLLAHGNGLYVFHFHNHLGIVHRTRGDVIAAYTPPPRRTWAQWFEELFTW